MVTIKQEIKKTLTLALPLVGVYVGHQIMGITDTLVIGRVGTAELGAVGVGSAFFGGFSAVGIGLLLGLETLISQSVGSKNHRAANQLLSQGLILSALISFLMIGLIYLSALFFDLVGATPEITKHTKIYLFWVSWSILPNLLFVTLMKYWQSYHKTLPGTYMMVFGNGLNIFLDLAFVIGFWGFPQLGVVGVAIASLGSRFAMLLLMCAYTLYQKKDQKFKKIEFDLRIQKKLLKLGIPAGSQFALEVGAFVIVTFLAARLGEIETATHHIALSLASLTFMVPLSFSSAAATRVGFHIGAKNYDCARQAGWISMSTAVLFMCLTAVIFISFPEEIYGLFNVESDVLEMGKSILILAGIFQVFDAIQVTATGALRGIGDTKTSMIANLIGHYPGGLLVGSVLCFGYGLGLQGLWIGLISGLICVSLILLYAWKASSSRLDDLQVLVSKK